MEKILVAYAGHGPVAEEDAKKLTHINVAFGHLHTDGRVDGTEHMIAKQIPELRKWNPALKISLSMVAAEPEAFTKVAGDEALRKMAAKNLADICKAGDFDGIDLDWEYPCIPSNGVDCTVADRQNFTLLLSDIRQALNEEYGTGKDRKLLTIATGADRYYCECTEIDRVSEICDLLYVMTYDLKCGFHALSGHHTALYSNVGDVFKNSCDAALKLFESYRVPANKLVLGAAFYSRQWNDVPDRNHGFLQLCRTGGGYGPKFDELQANYINKNGYVRYWDAEAKAPFLFNGKNFISYDDEESLAEKAHYVNNSFYAGIFYWVYEGDRTGTLLSVLHRELK